MHGWDFRRSTFVKVGVTLFEDHVRNSVVCHPSYTRVLDLALLVKAWAFLRNEKRACLFRVELVVALHLRHFAA